MPANMTTHTDDIVTELDVAGLTLLRQAAEAAASAAQVTAGRIAAYVTAQRLRVERGEVGAVELLAIQRAMIDLNWRLAALVEGVA